MTAHHALIFTAQGTGTMCMQGRKVVGHSGGCHCSNLMRMLLTWTMHGAQMTLRNLSVAHWMTGSRNSVPNIQLWVMSHHRAVECGWGGVSQAGSGGSVRIVLYLQGPPLTAQSGCGEIHEIYWGFANSSGPRLAESI